MVEFPHRRYSIFNQTIPKYPNIKPKQFSIIACFLILLVYTISSSTIPLAIGAEQTVPEKALSIINNAVGIDTQKYTADQRPISDSEYFGATQKNVDFYLTSPDSKCRVVTSYVNDQLYKIYFSDYNGKISLNYKESNVIDIATGFLGRLENQTKDPLYQQLVSSLQDINPYQNITKSMGSMQLKFENTDDKTIRYRWTYLDSNGVSAERKNIVLNYEEGQLKSYINNWQLFEVKGKPSVSEKQALEIAIGASKEFSYNITNESGEVETIFGPFALADMSVARASLAYLNLDNQKEARGGNPFDLYPAWYVTLGLSQFYPGDVAGITVLIWADTGEVSGTHEIVTNSQIGGLTDNTRVSLTNSLQLSNQLLFAAVIISVFCVAGVLFRVTIVNKKAMAFDRKLTVKLRTMFTISIVLAMGASILIPTTGAIVPDSMSRIYTFENPSADHGFMNAYINQAEGVANGEVADYVEQRFDNQGGYFTEKYRGTAFTKSSVTSYIASDEANYDRTAVLAISHFRNRGRAFLPNSGLESERIWDYEIYPSASTEHFFTFLWVCNQAENREYTNGKVWPHYMGNDWNEGSGAYLVTYNRGSPIAFTGRDGFHSGGTWMNFDGYNYPDGSGQCYISFYGMSPMLSGLPVNTFLGFSGGNCKNFIEYFYHYALDYGYSVRDALNQASQDHFNNLDYVQCPLYLGYDSIWPGGSAFAGIHTAPGKKTLDLPGYYPIDYYYRSDPDENDWAYPNEMRVHGDTNVDLSQAGDPDPSPYVSVSATADVAATTSQYYTAGSNPTISWVCADDYGAYYCYVTEVIVDGVPHSPNEYGNVHTGSITFNNIQSSHSVVVHSAPYYYPITFNVFAHNDYCGDMLVNSWTEYRVAWEERDGPVYSHGSDLHGGGPVAQYVDYYINDPWGWGTDYFNYAYIPNWGGGSEQWCYSIPFDVWTFVWGNTVNIYYNWQGWYGMNGMPSNTAATDTGITDTDAGQMPTFPEGFTPPASTPYIYNATTGTYTPVK